MGLFAVQIQCMLSNNDIFRRIRFIYDFSNKQMLDIFKAADHTASFDEVLAWTKKDDAEGFKDMLDVELAVFLNGLINTNRGKKDGPATPPEEQLNNNIILRKLRIALNHKDEDMISALALAEMTVGKAELSAFFRKPGHKHYRECKDQLLRNYLKGLAIKEMPEKMKNDNATEAP